MKPGGLLLIVAGIWLVAQLVRGKLLDRIGV